MTTITMATTGIARIAPGNVADRGAGEDREERDDRRDRDQPALDDRHEDQRLGLLDDRPRAPAPAGRCTGDSVSATTIIAIAGDDRAGDRDGLGEEGEDPERQRERHADQGQPDVRPDARDAA